MKRFALLALVLLSACAAPEQPGGPVPVQAAPATRKLTITPHPLLPAYEEQQPGGPVLTLRPTTSGVAFRIRLSDGSYSAAYGGEQGQVIPAQGMGIGPLDSPTSFDLLDAGRWVTFARYE